MNSSTVETQDFYKEKVITSPIFEKKNLDILKRRVIQLCFKGPVEAYLDLGCGSGHVTTFIAQLVKSKQTHSIEVSDASIQQASKLSILCKKADLNQQRLPYSDNSFDLITAFEIVEHLWNKDNVLKESFRVAKPSGFLLITTPNLLSFLSRMMVVFGYLPMHLNLSFEYEVEKRPFQKGSDLYGHISLYSTKTLMKHLESVGFKTVSVDGLSFPYMTRFRILSFLDRMFGKRPSLATDILVIAQKPSAHSNLIS